MKVGYGQGKTEYGPGVSIDLTGDEVAVAIYAYLVAHQCYTKGPVTVTVNGKLCEFGRVYVDPSGDVVYKGKGFSGRGKKRKAQIPD
jgi:hypothetical protein